MTCVRGADIVGQHCRATLSDDNDGQCGAGLVVMLSCCTLLPSRWTMAIPLPRQQRATNASFRWQQAVALIGRSEINQCWNRTVPTMRLDFQLSCVWFGIQLVSVVSATTESTCGMMRFKQARSETGDVLCATSPSPTAASSMKTKEQCSWACAHSPAVCAAGFNFKHQETLCEMFLDPPTTFEVQQDCEHYTVCTRLYRLCSMRWCVTIYYIL